MRFLVFALILAAMGHVAAARADLQSDLAELSRGLPSRVAAVVTRHAYCNHWADEEPYDRARAIHLEQAVKKLRCDRLDRDEASIRKRYAGNARVLKALDDVRDFYP